MTLKIYKWSAKQAGAFLTATGVDEEGRACKRTRVVSIEAREGRVLATTELLDVSELVV